MKVTTARKYRIQKIMLVPAQWQGSVEHFYHFMFGYFMPVSLWQNHTNAMAFALRDCGPMNKWFDLLAPQTSVEFIQPGVMLQRVLTKRQESQIFWDWDNPTRFNRKSIRKFSNLIIARVCGSFVPPAETQYPKITVMDRRVSNDFYKQTSAEVAGSGAEIRSVPNLHQLPGNIQRFGDVSLVDASDLTPREQVSLFSRTDILIGQHGAGLSNMLWMRPNSTVIEIQPPLAPTIDSIFANLARSLSIRHVLVRQQDEHSSIDLNDLVETIPRIIAGQEGSVPKSQVRFPLNVLRQMPRSW
jgi:hypothetical protein